MNCGLVGPVCVFLYMWNMDLWVLQYVCSYVKYGLVGPVCVFLYNIICGTKICGILLWNVDYDLWVLYLRALVGMNL